MGIPRKSDFEGYQDLITALPQDWGKQTSLLESINKILHKPRSRKKGAMTPWETETDLSASVRESLMEAWISSGLLQGQRHW